jgi:hypothetical protein
MLASSFSIDSCHAAERPKVTDIGRTVYQGRRTHAPALEVRR